MRNGLITFIVLLFSQITFGQLFPPFQWCYDGYQIGGSTSYNVNNSGIDIEISGFVNESCFGGTVKTGLNNTQSDSIQHKYVFKFSETISIQFQVRNVNYGTGYNDQLVFSGDPVFFESSGVTFSNDTIFPGAGSFDYDGTTNVYYAAVDSIEIIHGTGLGYNPGYIVFSEMYLNAYPPDLPSTECFQGNHFLSKENQTLLLNKIYSDVVTIDLFNELGQDIPVKYSQEDEIIRFPIGNLSSGVYFVIVQLDCGQVISEKVFIE